MRSQSATCAERFETLYREHHGDVLRFTPRCADPATAEDVANETFAICWRRLDHVPRTAPLAWLYTTARYVSGFCRTVRSAIASDRSRHA